MAIQPASTWAPMKSFPAIGAGGMGEGWQAVSNGCALTHKCAGTASLQHRAELALPS